MPASDLTTHAFCGITQKRPIFARLFEKSYVFRDTQTVVIKRRNQVVGTLNRRFGRYGHFRCQQSNVFWARGEGRGQQLQIVYVD
jgi:hypothetical protein